jgi:hypothetical protein
MALAFAGHAQNVNNRFSLLSFTNLSPQQVTFEVDGKQYPAVGNVLDLNNVRPGPHPVKVYGNGPGAVPKRVLLYSNTVNVKPQVYVDIIINRFGRVVMDEQPITAAPVVKPGPPPGNQYPNQGNPYPPVNNQGNNQNNWNNQNGQGYNNGYPRDNHNYPPRPIDDNTFNSFVETVRHESFDDSRMAIAKVGIDQNFFTSAQAKTLLSIFSFEASKLEISKYMYGKITDPKNYFIVYNVFTFSKSKEELAEYVRTYK